MVEKDRLKASSSEMIRAPRDAAGIPHCPKCGGPVPSEDHPGEYPGALSRTDNMTEICSRCGEDEAVAGIKRPTVDVPPNTELNAAIVGKGVEGMAFHGCSVAEIGWCEWVLRFRPIRDEHGNICRTEDVLRAAAPDCVWSDVFLGEDEGFAVYNGTYGEMAYLTEVPVPSGLTVMVWDEPTWTDEEARRVEAGLVEWQSEMGLPSHIVAIEEFREWFWEHNPEDGDDFVNWGLGPLIKKHLPCIEVYPELGECEEALDTADDDE